MFAPAHDFLSTSFVFIDIPGSFVHFSGADLPASAQAAFSCLADLNVSATPPGLCLVPNLAYTFGHSVSRCFQGTADLEFGTAVF
jgi:hypothetical protein